MMMQQFFTKMTVHPPSHRLWTATKDWFASPGMMCPVRAVVGKWSQSNSQVCEETKLFPSGNFTVRGESALFLFFVGACT